MSDLEAQKPDRRKIQRLKVCLDISPAIHNHAGIGRYVQELIGALLVADVRHEYVAFYNRPIATPLAPPFNQLSQLTVRSGDKPWRLKVGLSHFLRHPQDHLFPGIDLFHATDNVLPYFSRKLSVFTLYDIAFRFYPETHTRLNRWFLTLMLPRYLRAAQAITTISECTKRDAVRLYRIDADKIRVIYPGVASHFQAAKREAITQVHQRYRLPERYLLYVSTLEPRKNLLTLLEALRHTQLSDTKLVVVGKKGWLYDSILRRVQTLGLERQIIFTGFIPDEDLRALYSAALALVYPSLYEGFGLPVLEAMACGTPVLCSNSSSLPEAAGEAAILLPSRDVRAWVEALTQITRNSALQSDLRQRGLSQAARFPWSATARQTLEVYQGLYVDHP